MSEEQIKQDVVDEEVSEPTEATKEQSEAQNAEESVVDASEVLEELKADFDNRYKRLQADFENLNAVLIKKKNSWQALLRAMS